MYRTYVRTRFAVWISRGVRVHRNSVGFHFRNNDRHLSDVKLIHLVSSDFLSLRLCSYFLIDFRIVASHSAAYLSSRRGFVRFLRTSETDAKLCRFSCNFCSMYLIDRRPFSNVCFLFCERFCCCF